MITLDWTIAAAGVVFLFTLWALNRFLFRPLFQVLDQRKELTSDTQESASDQLLRRDALLEEYLRKLKEEKQRGYQMAESTRLEAAEVRKQKVASARQETETILAEAREQVERELEVVRNSLRKEAHDIASMITARILRKI